MDRLPPYSLEAEEGVLGCILLSPGDCLPQCIELGVRPEWFFSLPNRTLLEVLREMHDASTPIDLISLKTKLDDTKKLEAAGGLAVISGLPDRVPSASHLGHYIEILREKHVLRAMLRICGETASRIYAEPEAGGDIIARAEQDILLLNSERIPGVETSWRDLISEVIDQIEDYTRGGAQLIGLSSGIPYLDKMTCGFSPSQFILIAARPSVGKTSLGMTLVEHIAMVKKIPVGIFSLEMTGRQIAAGALFRRAQADYQRFRTGYMVNEDVAKLVSAAKIGAAPIWIDTDSTRTIDDICAIAVRWKREHDIRCLIIDYVALIDTDERFRENREKIAWISKRLKRLAKKLNIPVIVLAQLNRESVKDNNRVPGLQDLADCDDLGRDADLVLMLYKVKIDFDDDADNSEASITRRVLGHDWSDQYTRINIEVAKQREGPTGKCEMIFHKASMKFLPFERNRTNTLPDEEK